MKKTGLLILCNLLIYIGELKCQPVFSQCIKKEQITYGGDFGFSNYIHLCPTVQFTDYGDTSKTWDFFYAININRASKNVLKVKKYVEESVKSYAGAHFFSKVKFDGVEVVYADSLQVFIDHGQNVSLTDCKAKYFFYYNFKPDTIAVYNFGIAVNEGGKIISSFDFPSKKDYGPFDSTFTYCKLIEIARSVQKKIDPIKEISLQYDSTQRRFYWLISQDLVNEKEGVNYYNEVLIDAMDLKKVNLRTEKVYVEY